MLRTRLFWFSVGFAATSASISQFVWRDLLAHRCALSSDASFVSILKFSCSFTFPGGFQIVVFDVVGCFFLSLMQIERNFDALEARISNLESVRNRDSIPSAEVFLFLCY